MMPSAVRNNVIIGVLSKLYPLYISVDAEFSFVMDIHTSLNIAVLTLLYISIPSILPICCHCCLPHYQNLDIREDPACNQARNDDLGAVGCHGGLKVKLSNWRK